MITFSKLGKFGRLGNQLFQIAATIGIAKSNDHSYIFPEWEYSRYFRNKLPTGCLPKTKKIKQKHPWYYPIKIGPGNFDLEGFFQSEDFFTAESTVIRKYFQPVKELEQNLNNKYGDILQKNTCSIHLRRGDYLKFRHSYPPLPVSYYQSAMNQFSKETLFVIFSDDIEWCKNNFPFRNTFFIENESEINDLFLMSKCKNHIIANSSFSWWGAWLNPDIEKKIIAPSYWFGPANTLRFKRKNAALLSSHFHIIEISNEPGRIFSFFIYIFAKSKYFMIYKMKNIIPSLIRRKINIIVSKYH